NQLVASVDVVVDASDNFETRHAVNRACILHSKPLVSGTAINYVGQLAVFDLRNENTPCYACFVPENTPNGVDQCSTSGVLASLTGTIGTMQATEVINLLVAGSSRLNGRAVLYDARESELSSMPIKKRSDCAICS
ncbi:MAG: ThiF family adenylyltransferase, partial [Gammaproteobacteria bacterium]